MHYNHVSVRSPHHGILFSQNILGRFCSGTAPAMIVIPPFIMPEAPQPAIARPPISMAEELATPQIREPSSKIPKKMKKVHYCLSVCIHSRSRILLPMTHLCAEEGIHLSSKGLERSTKRCCVRHSLLKV